MDRIINVKVGGNYLSKDNKNAGVRGESNVTKLRIVFDEGWDNFAKSVTFWDARGANPVQRILTTDLLENISENTRVYLVPIPAEPMAEAGTLTFIIDGYTDGKIQRSFSDKLEIKDAPIADNAEEPVDPTPTQAEQLQTQIDGIMNTIQNAVIAGQNAKTSEENANNSANSALSSLYYTEEKTSVAEMYADDAERYATKAKTSEENAENSANSALNSSNQSQEYAEEAKEHAAKAQNAVGKTSYVGNNGNWFAWDSENNEFYDTGIRAQSGSEVYIGNNPPDEADVWIDPNGESAIYAPYIGDNGNWYTFNPETQAFEDSGDQAVIKDNNCELIEEITITEDGIREIVRNRKPDGTPYDFKAVTVYQQVKPCEVQNLIQLLAYDHVVNSTSGNDDLLGFQGSNAPATAGRFCVGHFDVIGGCWKVIGSFTTIQDSPTGVSMWRYTTPYKGEHIKSVAVRGYTTSLEVGTVIRIYGVRA